MKKNKIIIPLMAASAILSTSCSDWDDHFDAAGLQSSAEVSVYDGDIVSYMKSTGEVSQMSSLYERTGIYKSILPGQSYSFIVCDNSIYNAGRISNDSIYARYSASNMNLAPSLLTDGFGIQTLSGKSIWVHRANDQVKLDDYDIKKIVKTDNGYVYYVSDMLPVRQSVYEYIQSLDDQTYSEFKKLVEAYDERWFDREHSQIIGSDPVDGSTLYDSVFVTRNTLMDRYTSDGQETWNMRDEKFNSTLFVPTNQQIEKAINDACDSIPVWLNREPTAADSAKFRQWIVKACFVDRKLDTEAVNQQASDFDCVGGYKKIIDKLNDKTSYEEVEAAHWKPAVQRANTAQAVHLSNGTAYPLEALKIPNHVVIYRVKSRFYELWNAMSADQQREYFSWSHWTSPIIINDAQGSFYSNTTQMGNYPDVLYNVLAAIPDDEATENQLPCSMTFTGVGYDEDNDEVYECHLPAGEYYLRMGFIHSLTYSLSIYFNGENVVRDMAMGATGSNYHFDRCGASDVPVYGSTYQTGYPEGYNPKDWLEINANANLYDTDGWTVGVVRLKQSGTFKIKVESKDESKFWKDNGNDKRDKNNKNQFMIYHWCLRPTSNNY